MEVNPCSSREPGGLSWHPPPPAAATPRAAPHCESLAVLRQTPSPRACSPGMSAARFRKCQGRSLLAGLLASRPGIPGGICVYCTRSRRVQGTEVLSKLRLGQTVVTPPDLGGVLMESHPRATSLSPRLCC